MPEPGVNSYLILGEQGVDWDTSAAALETIIYEFVTCGLRNVGDNIYPNRMQRNPSPTRGIGNFFHAEGDIQLHLHAEDMLVWWKHILMDAAIGSVDFTAQEVHGNGSGSPKAWTTPASLDTQPGDTTPSSAPGKLSATLSAASTGTMTITGTNHGDQVISEVLTFAAETGPITTTKYFKTVAANGIVETTGDLDTADLYIESDRDIYTHTIQLGDAIDDGMTFEVVKGVLPSVYLGVLLNSGVLDIGDVITLTVNAMAKRGWNRHKYVVSDDPTPSDTPTDVSGYTRVNDLVFPAWSLELVLDAAATPIPVSSCSFNFSNALAFLTRFRGSRTEPKPTRSGNRDILLTIGVDYEAAADTWDATFLCGDDVQADLYVETTRCSGPLYSVKVKMPRTQIAAFPDPEVTDYAEVIQELQLRPIRSIGATTSDEVEVVIEDGNAGI